jgi:hypothetical protein
VTESELREDITRFEAHLELHQFPQSEGPIGGTVNRWVQLLATHTQGLNAQDFSYLATLDSTLSWNEAVELYVKRLVRNRDPMSACKQFDELQQSDNQRVLAFADEFVQLRQRCSVSGDDSWKQGDLLTHFLFVKKLRPELRQALQKDHRWHQVSGGPFSGKRELAAAVEQELSFSLFGSGAGNRKRNARSLSSEAESEVSTGEDQGQGPPKKKRKKGSSKRIRVPDREQLDDSSGFQHEEQPCGRCGKLFHKEEDCMSEFHKEGSRLGNKPPGQGPKWKPSGKKCNKCGSSEHLSFFDGCPGPRKEPAAGVLSDQEKLQRKFQQPSVRAIMMDSKGASNQLVNGEKLKCILCDIIVPLTRAFK